MIKDLRFAALTSLAAMTLSTVAIPGVTEHNKCKGVLILCADPCTNFISCEDECNEEHCTTDRVTIFEAGLPIEVARCECSNSGPSRCCQVVFGLDDNGAYEPYPRGGCKASKDWCAEGNTCILDYDDVIGGGKRAFGLCVTQH